MVEPTDFDTSMPNAARMYDYWLGGKDNFAADREAADRSAQAVPQLPFLARENRRFLGRAVRYCVAAGISQFLDIGSGLPTMENVHQVARDANVVYVDVDPVVVNHAQALLASPRVAAIRGDVTEPADILGAPDVRRLIDVTRPVAILLVSVLHFIPDEAGPFDAVATLRDAMAPGSFLVIAHVAISPAVMAAQSQTASDLADARKGSPTGPARGTPEIAGFFGDLTLVEPGLTDVWSWRPDAETVVTPSDFMTLVGGVGRKD